MTDHIRVRFLGEEREFRFSRDIGEGFVVYETVVDCHRFTLTRYDGTGGGQKTGWTGGGLRGIGTALLETAQQAADAIEDKLRPLAKALSVLSPDKREPAPIREAIDALNRAISDGLPQESERLLLRAITLTREAGRIARVAFENGYVGKRNDFSDLGIDVEAEDDDELPDRALPAELFEPTDEPDTLPPPDEKTEPMAAPFAITATGALKR